MSLKMTRWRNDSQEKGKECGEEGEAVVMYKETSEGQDPEEGKVWASHPRRFS